ncbi:MAG: hypothetical protein GY725_19790 [bacterium]|nr:hypothetical protein [bacterium]
MIDQTEELDELDAPTENNSPKAEERECGPCMLCCKLLKIGNFDPPKPANTWCPHAVMGSGCGSYEERPEPCRVFNCIWKQGALRDKDRPDKARILVSLQDRKHIPDLPVATLPVVYERESGAHKGKQAAEIYRLIFNSLKGESREEIEYILIVTQPRQERLFLSRGGTLAPATADGFPDPPKEECEDDASCAMEDGD